jgi:hypothetical protein
MQSIFADKLMLCGVQVQQAAAWPAEGPGLTAVYVSLLRFLLAHWVSGVCVGGKGGSWGLSLVEGVTVYGVLF